MVILHQKCSQGELKMTTNSVLSCGWMFVAPSAGRRGLQQPGCPTESLHLSQHIPSAGPGAPREHEPLPRTLHTLPWLLRYWRTTLLQRAQTLSSHTASIQSMILNHLLKSLSWLSRLTKKLFFLHDFYITASSLLTVYLPPVGLSNSHTPVRPSSTSSTGSRGR